MKEPIVSLSQFSTQVNTFLTWLQLVILTIYMSFVYAMVYLAFMAFPISFDRGWLEGIASLPFIALCIGVVAACIATGIFSKTFLIDPCGTLGYKITASGLSSDWITALTLLSLRNWLI